MATRAEHRRNTMLALSDAAIELFEDQGAAATIDDIATRAGVARRTVFRYVDGKEALAFIHPVLWFDVFEAGLASAPASPLSDRLRIGSRAIALHIDADPDPPRRAFSVVAAAPELARGYAGVFQRWVDRIATEVLVASSDPTSADAQFRSRIIGAAIMGMVDAVTRQWVFSPGSVKFVDLYDQGFALLEPLLSDS